MATTTIAAEFTKGSKVRPNTLAITRIASGRREYLSEHPVADKREARALAARLNAQPWNF